MKAFLLAAGHGTRLKPLTDTIPKCLLPVCGRPMLEIWLDICARSGITDVLINVHAHAGAIQRHLAGCDSPVRVRVVCEETLLGSAGTLAANRRWVATEPAFWVLYSDVLTNANLPKILEFHLIHRPIATLGVYQVADPTRCGIAVTDAHASIVEFEEKPKHPRGNLAFSGVIVASPSFVDHIPNRAPVDIGYDVLPQLVGRMKAYCIDDYLLDIGTLGNYETAQRTWPGLRGQIERPSLIGEAL